MAAVHAGARRRDLRASPPTTCGVRRQIVGEAEQPAHLRAAGRLPVAPGDGVGVRGEQHQPPARDDRPAGCRDPADERPADGAEHARDRLQRRPARLPQLAERGSTSPSSPGSGTSSRLQIPHWGPPTHAMEIFRYAEQGSIGFLWVSGTNPAVSLPDLRPDPVDPLAGEPVPGRLGRLPDRDGAARGRRPARRRCGARRRGRSRTPTAPSTSPSRRSTRPGEARPDVDDLRRLRPPAGPEGQGRSSRS